MNLKAREKTTQIRQTLDAIGADLAHRVANGNADVTDAVWVVVSVHGVNGNVLDSFQMSVVPTSEITRAPILIWRKP